MKSVPAARVLPRGRVAKWTKERLDALSTLELRQLFINAQQLKETEIAALCDEILSSRPRGHKTVRKEKPKGSVVRRLVSRTKAFEAKGVALKSRSWSRSGVRESDGAVVLCVWADDVQNGAGAASCLLWAPNVDGKRPWSDKPGGQERLEHCRLALTRGTAEGLLVYGTRLEGMLPEEKAKVDGADARNALDLKVEMRGDEYWATWIPHNKRVMVME